MSEADGGRGTVRLRTVHDEDRVAYEEFQNDPEANAMAASTARDHAAFVRHWTRLVSERLTTSRTVVAGTSVAGLITAWGEGPQREVAYWFGRAFWGRGIATTAVGLFLDVERARPLVAHVAAHNLASRRVCKKLGFRHEGAVLEGGVCLLRLVLA